MLKQKRWIRKQTHNIHVNSRKQYGTYDYKYDYIQVTEILMFSDLQHWRCKSHWLNMHLIKCNLSTWIKL